MSVITLTDYRPSARYDGNAWVSARVEGAPAKAGPWTAIETFTLDPVDPDPSEPQTRSFTTELLDTATWVRVVFIDGDSDEEQTIPLALAPAAFATRVDVQRRLGRDLTDTEGPAADYLLEAATSMIAASADKDDDWAAALDPVPGVLRSLCVELAVRSLANPQGLTSLREQLGQRSYALNYRGGDAGGSMVLTPTEEMIARRAVFGTLSGSARVLSAVDELYDFYYS